MLSILDDFSVRNGKLGCKQGNFSILILLLRRLVRQQFSLFEPVSYLRETGILFIPYIVDEGKKWKTIRFPPFSL